MGKLTGFLDYERQDRASAAPEDRVASFDEFHHDLDAGERQCQGGRCMDCGVPFCQSGVTLGGMFTGCPLHNLVPEWNDMIYRGNWEHALSRLLKTTNFPEFTGRVCPALCEAACTCGVHGDPVTVRDNELAVIEHGYANGLMEPRVPELRTTKRVAVVGSGPSGLAVADQLNHRGHNVCVFERADRPGGLLMYGIPNMKLSKDVVARRIGLMEREGVTFECGVDVGRKGTAKRVLGEYDAVVLCCGASEPRDLKAPGRDTRGIQFAVDFLSKTTRSLLEGGDAAAKVGDATGKDVIVVGGGDTGNDCIGTCMRQGCKSLVALEMMPEPPVERAADNPWPQWPRVLKHDYGHEEAAAAFGVDPRRFQTTVSEFHADDEGNLCAVTTVRLKPKRDKKTGRVSMVPVKGSEETLPCQLLLIAAGFVGAQKYVTRAFGLELDERGRVACEGEGHATAQEKVFCAGDMRRGQSLVVWGIAEGRACAAEVDKYLMGYSLL